MRLCALLRRGLFPHQCSPECREGKSKEQNYITCPQCEGSDANCAACGGDVDGVEIVGCPYKIVTQEVSDVVDAADLIKQSGWPNGNGWANEPACLVDAVHFVWWEFKRIDSILAKRL